MLENSGVAEPQNIRDKFSEAIAMGNPLMSRIQLDTMATIVDSGSFTADYSSRTPVSGNTGLHSVHAVPAEIQTEHSSTDFGYTQWLLAMLMACRWAKYFICYIQ